MARIRLYRFIGGFGISTSQVLKGFLATFIYFTLIAWGVICTVIIIYALWPQITS